MVVKYTLRTRLMNKMDRGILLSSWSIRLAPACSSLIKRKINNFRGRPANGSWRGSTVKACLGCFPCAYDGLWCTFSLEVSRHQNRTLSRLPWCGQLCFRCRLRLK